MKTCQIQWFKPIICSINQWGHIYSINPVKTIPTFYGVIEIYTNMPHNTFQTAVFNAFSAFILDSYIFVMGSIYIFWFLGFEPALGIIVGYQIGKIVSLVQITYGFGR